MLRSLIAHHSVQHERTKDWSAFYFSNVILDDTTLCREKEILLTEKVNIWLSFNDVAFTAKALATFETIISSVKNITMISFNRNPESTSFWKTVFTALTNARSLTDLVINNCYLTDNEMPLLCDFLSNRVPLQHLDLDSNRFTKNGLSQLSHTLCKSPNNVTRLILNGNAIEEIESAINLIDHNQLINLSLANCGLTDEHLTAIAEALKLNLSLYTLNLFGKEYTQLGIEALYKAISTYNFTLKKLNLFPFYQAIHYILIQECLKDNRRLQKNIDIASLATGDRILNAYATIRFLLEQKGNSNALAFPTLQDLAFAKVTQYSYRIPRIVIADSRFPTLKELCMNVIQQNPRQRKILDGFTLFSSNLPKKIGKPLATALSNKVTGQKPRLSMRLFSETKTTDGKMQPQLRLTFR